MLISISGTCVGLSVKDHKLALNHLLVIASNCAAQMDSEFNVTKHIIINTNLYCFYNKILVIYTNDYLFYYSLHLELKLKINFQIMDNIHLMAIDERCHFSDLRLVYILIIGVMHWL
jgi:hypothetical protein